MMATPTIRVTDEMSPEPRATGPLSPKQKQLADD